MANELIDITVEMKECQFIQNKDRVHEEQEQNDEDDDDFEEDEDDEESSSGEKIEK